MRAFDIIEEAPQHHIQDATKITCMQQCPRKYFFEYVLGWRPETPNNHLVFGSAWHKAMEVFGLKGYSGETVMEAYQAFLEEYREVFPPETDELFHPKTPENALIVLAHYAKKWNGQEDNIRVLHVEVGGKIAINEEDYLHFRMDTICQGPQGYFSREHKTASSFYQWELQWPLSIQIGTYTHVLRCLYPIDQVRGIEMNGVAFRKVKKAWEQLKEGKNLTVEPPFDFQRLMIPRSPAQMNSWLWNVQFWYDLIKTNFQWLSECSPDDPVLTAFPMNGTSCTAYSGCQWHDFCCTWPNPLTRCEEPPLGFMIEHWDPSKEEVKTKVDVNSEGVASI